MVERDLEEHNNQTDHKSVMCPCKQIRSTASWTTLRAVLPGREKANANHDSALVRPGVGSPENTDWGAQEWFHKRDTKTINRLDTEHP